ncbi:MAG TPA: hypothetical protein VN792_01555, partial [Candidatus Acidoferrales bacterium]|nr:hypothetical protein [Candidatus Acidoferrales bacterium]
MRANGAISTTSGWSPAGRNREILRSEAAGPPTEGLKAKSRLSDSEWQQFRFQPAYVTLTNGAPLNA